MADVAPERERAFSLRDTVARWTSGEDWRTWVAHAVFALIYTFAFGLYFELAGDDAPGEIVGSDLASGGIIAIGYYLLREIEQTFYSFVQRKEIDWRDNVMDVAVPALAVGVVVGLVALISA